MTGVYPNVMTRSIEDLPMMSWELTESGDCLQVSRFWRKATGKEPVDFMDTVHPDDRMLLSEKLNYNAFAQKDHPARWGFRVRQADGSYQYIVHQVECKKYKTGKRTFIGFGIALQDEKEVHQQQQNAEEVTDSILDTLMSGVLKVNLSGRIIFANPAAAKILDLNVSEITGRYYQSHEWKQIDLNGKPYPPERLPLAIALHEKKRVENIQHGIKYEGLTKWLTVSAAPIFSKETGELTGAVASFDDITRVIEVKNGYKRSVQELKNFRQALDRSAIISITDRHGRIIEANDMFCHVSGYARKELIGQDHSIINSGYHGREYFRELWRTIARGKPWRGETRNRRKDGSIYWVDTIISPLYDENGKIDRYLSVRYDITERKKSEHQLNDLALVAKETDNMVIITDAKEKIEWVNAGFTRVTGYTLEEVEGKKPGHVLQGEGTDPKAVNRIRKAFNKEQGVEVELLNYRKSGAPYWAHINIQPVFDEQGRLVKYISIQSDITEERKAEEQLVRQNDELRKANNELDNFVYRVSHDLRAPIASSLGLIELCTQLDDVTQIKEYLELQRKSLKKLDHFIGDILDYSRNSRVEVARQPIDWEELIQSIRDGLSNANNQHIDFQYTIEAKGAFEGDEMRIRVILGNLLSNAFKFTKPFEPKPWVKLKVMSDTKGAKITVSDNGTGIDRESQGKIFDMFYRATDTNYGTGLGLYIVKESIDRLKGTIRVRSKNNEGTTFHVWIPGE